MIEFVKFADNEECEWVVVDDDGMFVNAIADGIVEIGDNSSKALHFYNEESAWGIALELQTRTYRWYGVIAMNSR